MNSARVSVTCALIVLLLAACGDGVARFTIEGKDNLTFTPNTITIKPGQRVELTLVNNGKLPHTFTVPDLNLEAQMPPGVTNKMTFTAPESGEYRFYSAVLSEFDTMTGKIVVSISNK